MLLKIDYCNNVQILLFSLKMWERQDQACTKFLIQLSSSESIMVMSQVDVPRHLSKPQTSMEPMCLLRKFPAAALASLVTICLLVFFRKPNGNSTKDRAAIFISLGFCTDLCQRERTREQLMRNESIPIEMHRSFVSLTVTQVSVNIHTKTIWVVVRASMLSFSEDKLVSVVHRGIRCSW